MTDTNFSHIKPYPLGAHVEYNRVRFSFVSKEDDCGVLIYQKKSGKLLLKLPFSRKEKIGNIYCKYFDEVPANQISYQFYEGDKTVPDRYARMFANDIPYGKEKKLEDLKALIPCGEFDWEGDVLPKIPYQDCICYCLHVRGFTRHSSSKVSKRGTFAGLVEKIDYLKQTGITTIELQPAYEFTEIPTMEERMDELGGNLARMTSKEDLDQLIPPKCNYWGYKLGFYYAPKASYAHASDTCIEFKEMIRAFHKEGMEVVMQFYFPKSVKTLEITDILKYWVLEYHVDGFHLMGEALAVDIIAADEMLADTKLWYYDFHTDALYQENETPRYKNLASYNDAYLYTMRKFLKGDENMINSVVYEMRNLPAKTGRIHYLSNYYGFTLMDMVSYERKHNELNGEENRDGNDYNCSWNCGEEGTTRRKKIQLLRKKQIKNAMFLLLFCQSTPLIFMGDEFGNSQEGNNNPYCQDNAITWLDWNDLKKNEELYAFWIRLVALRKRHGVLHPQKPCKIMDYLSCGYPDLSYHGESAWRPALDYYSRNIGIMYCGNYGQDDFIYLAYNMHWESKKLALPKLPAGLKWKLEASTETESTKLQTKSSLHEGNPAEETVLDGGAPDLEILVPARSCAIYISVVDENAKPSKNRKNKAQVAFNYENRTMF